MPSLLPLRYAQVALPVPRLDTFTYVVPDDLAVAVGCRVTVPLGKRTATGTVVGITEEPPSPLPDGPLKSVLEVLDEAPVVTPSVLALTQRVAQYYLCSWGEAIQAAMPSDVPPNAVLRVSLARTVTDDDVAAMARKAPRRAELLQVLRQHNGDISVSYLQKRLKSATIADQVDALHMAGWIEVDSSTEHVGVRMQKAYRVAPQVVSDADATRTVLDELDKRAPRQSLLLSILIVAHLRNEGPTLRTTLLDEEGASASALGGLVAKGHVEEFEMEVETAGKNVTAADNLAQSRERDAVLTDEQQRTVDAVTATKGFGVIALEGVTGSGKTLVYIHAIRHMLAQEKTALVLVPEIALTPQLGDRFQAVFGDSVAVMHSKLALGERARIARRIRDGRVRVVLGARSAVWVPLTNVGIIIVDEEHEPSYKQDDPAPRYHGRDVAILRASIEGCPAVLGSATLSLETRYNILQRKYMHLQLQHRADGAVLPVIQVVDMRVARKAAHVTGAFVDDVLELIRQRVRASEGTLVFLNRRGFASQLQCHDCGDVPGCPNCDVKLTFHKSTYSLRCHYCGYSEAARTMCTVCGGTSMMDTGTGTQRLEEELTAALSQARNGEPAIVERMDADTGVKRHAHRAVLARFSRGEVDVIVGTQMIAKGLDLPRVTLVVVVNADQSIFQNDFRASERTVQLLTQVAGRAGRTAAQPGAVYIQTSMPDHPAIMAVTGGTMQAWSAMELQSRREAGYPPFTRFITVEASGFYYEAVLDKAHILAALIPEHTPYMVRLPVVTPAIGRIRNRYRQVIVIKNDKQADPTGAMCRSLLRNALEAYHASHASSAVRVVVDVDASGMI